MTLFATLWTVAHQAPPSMRFSRQEYWSGWPFPSPGESSRPRDWTRVSRIVDRRFTVWATREVQLFKKLCSRNVEPQMEGTICRMTCQFSTVWGLVSQFPHFAGSTVYTSFYISVPESVIFWGVLSCKWGSHAYEIKFDFFLWISLMST